MPDIDISIVVPLYNEEECANPLYDSITNVMIGLNRRYEIIFVDDGSVDATFLRAKAIHQEDPRLKVIKFRKNYGQTPAMQAGFDHAKGKIIISMDGDLQNDPKDIPKFLEKIEGSPKVGIISGTGDRRDEDLIEFGAVSAELFDEIVIRQDSYLRGRKPKEIVDLLIKGIRKKYKKKPIEVIYNEKEAITTVINNAKEGSFITIVSAIVPDALDTVIKLKEKESKVKILKADYS